jgi:predicted AlkP superfamily pyrophosphatase or phosphodiesterase
MRPTLVLNVVGLTSELLGEHTPNLCALQKTGAQRALNTIVPAVTCSVQATLLTGSLPREHGIVGNGWYFRELAEVWFWRQSNRLVQRKKLWELGRERDAAFAVANLFWWYNMYSSADWSVTPRPQYPADGRKIPDIYTQPAELRDELTQKLGQFPLFRFWGPAADIVSSRWITDAALHVLETRKPTLELVYLPHLDYDLQRFGPDLSQGRVRQSLEEVDGLCGELIASARNHGYSVIVLSEYGITPVNGAVAINRALREAGWLRVRHESGRELLDAGASAAFAVVDHQVAHIYLQRPGISGEVKACVAALDGVERVLDAPGIRELGLDHERSGELIAISRADRWFSYYYWLDPERAPDFAPTVDIHKKPGYDPVELFVNPKLSVPKLAVGWRLAKRAAGFRTLMDVISSEDTALVKGSHGRLTDRPEQGPLVISERADLLGDAPLAATGVSELILRHVFG